MPLETVVVGSLLLLAEARRRELTSIARPRNPSEISTDSFSDTLVDSLRDSGPRRRLASAVALQLYSTSPTIFHGPYVLVAVR